MTNYPEWLRLRVLVLALGEAPHAAWWKSEFLSPAGLSFLGRVYPRRAFAAALTSAGLAARAIHDTAVGRGNIAHLFRLPESDERALHGVLTESGHQLAVEFTPVLSSQERLMAALEVLAGTAPGKTGVGPMRQGTARDLQKPSVIHQLAGTYYGAFRDGNKVFPFYEMER